MLDLAVNRSARYAALILIASISGASVLGGLQASNTLLNFTNVLVLAGSTAALTDGAVHI